VSVKQRYKLQINHISEHHKNHGRKLVEVNMAIESEPLTPVFAGINWESGMVHICIRTHTKILKREKVKAAANVSSAILSWIHNYSKQNNQKIIACGLVKNKKLKKIVPRLWLELDISPFVVEVKSSNKEVEAAKYVASRFGADFSYKAKVDKQQKVITTPLVTLSEYEAISNPDVFKRLLKETALFRGKKIVFVSATPQGGGVALMRHSIMRIYKLLGVKASWHVLLQDPQFFDITKKKLHNVFQGVSESHIKLEDKDKKFFLAWTKKNFSLLQNFFKKADVIVIDDPQPSGLVNLIKRKWPQKPVIYRSHIHLSAALANKKNTPQNIAWKFIWENVNKADIFVSHPLKSFVPKEVPDKKVIFMGASTDRLDGLNKELTDAQKSYYMRLFNKMLLDSGQETLDLTRPFIIQIARFDPSKGILDLIESYRKFRLKLDAKNHESPQLVIVGNASVDDPDGTPTYEFVSEMLSTDLYKHLACDIKMMRLPHFDQLLNTLLRESVIALQLSHKEGFEVKVSEALMKGKPVIATRTGGIPLQIKHKKSGFLVNVGDTEGVADYLFKLFLNKKLYQNMSTTAIKSVNEDVDSIYQSLYWLFIANQLLKNNFHGNAKYIGKLISL